MKRLLFVVLVLLAACSDDDDGAASNNSTTAATDRLGVPVDTTASSVATASSTSVAGPTPVDSCSILERAEIAEATGVQVQDMQRREQACVYLLEAAGEVGVDLGPLSGGLSGGERVAGVGDDARWDRASTTLRVKVGARLLTLRTALPSGTGDPKAAAVRLARIGVARIPGG